MDSGKENGKYRDPRGYIEFIGLPKRHKCEGLGVRVYGIHGRKYPRDPRRMREFESECWGVAVGQYVVGRASKMPYPKP